MTIWATSILKESVVLLLTHGQSMTYKRLTEAKLGTDTQILYDGTNGR